MHTHFEKYRGTRIVSSAGSQIEVTLYTIFASRKKPAETSGDKTGIQSSSITPANFQVSAKLDEETRKDGLLSLSFVISLNDAKGLVTYEFRGACKVTGTNSEFAAIMGTERNRVPPILDAIYQRLYPVIFLMSGVTIAPYPQATTLASEMVSSEQGSGKQPSDQPSEGATQVVSNNQPPRSDEKDAVVAKKNADKQDSGSADLVAA